MTGDLLVAERPDTLVVRGADRVRFLNAYITCDVRSAPAQGGRIEGFFTSREGRVLAPAGVSDRGEELWVDLPADAGAAVLAHLQRYIIADRVELALGATPAWRVVGAAAVERAAALPGVEIAIGPWQTAPAVVVWASQLDPALADSESKAAVAAFESTRIAGGVPRFGIDYHSGECFPQELGPWGAAAVNYDKGCYLGQEIIARIHWRGRVVRGPRWVDLPQQVQLGAEVRFEDRPVGVLTSVDAAAGIGLGILSLRVPAGAAVEVGEPAVSSTIR